MADRRVNVEGEQRLRQIMEIAERMLQDASSTRTTTSTNDNSTPGSDCSNRQSSNCSDTSGSTISSFLRPNNCTSASTGPVQQQLLVRQNFRSLFAPYSRPQDQRQGRPMPRSGRGIGRRSQGKSPVKETWTHDFFCLSKTNTSYPPGQKEKIGLTDAGLGRKKVTFSHDGDAAHVAKQLEKIYPKLQGCGGFEILRSQGAKETLRLLIPPRSGYSVIFLRDLSGLGSALGYIRPIQMNLSTSKVPPQDPMVSDHTNLTEQYLFIDQ